MVVVDGATTLSRVRIAKRQRNGLGRDGAEGGAAGVAAGRGEGRGAAEGRTESAWLLESVQSLSVVVPW